MMSEFDFCVPCLFGLEGLCADELKRLGMEAVSARNGQVLFSGAEPDIARSNMNLRTGERVLLVIGETDASTFDRLFEGVRAMPWEQYIPNGGEFPVKGHSLSSKLTSIPDCQKIVKKAVAERLKSKYNVEWLKETGAKYQIQFAIMNDTAALYIDTSGAGLHKRGYRPVGNAAPLRETLAAAIVKLSRYKGRESVCDPFCGSGTIAIEAALAAINRAPGLSRKFEAQSWSWLNKEIWEAAAAEARDREFKGAYDIRGSDIDPKSIKTAEENARRAGVAEHVRFEVADARHFSPFAKAGVSAGGGTDAAGGGTGAENETGYTGGIIMTNPPYGERVMQRSEAEELYREFGATVGKLKNWKMYVLSSHTEFERAFGKTAVKKRKLYNGMIKCDLFMYY